MLGTDKRNPFRSAEGGARSEAECAKMCDGHDIYLPPFASAKDGAPALVL
jgi:hypothetical protein